ncbi:nitric oxide synthase-interacting protein-like, partial [Anneissia japonica]|uniref:nitric oxide synthase-interacting protein-like n=1 Tax=Anneissia japonica TaxID=1529436 RepID=UPI0014255A4F
EYILGDLIYRKGFDPSGGAQSLHNHHQKDLNEKNKSSDFHGLFLVLDPTAKIKSSDFHGLKYLWCLHQDPSIRPTYLFCLILFVFQDKTIYCPISKKPIKMKDLITVKFTLADEKDSQPLVAKKVRYKCAVTHDILSNSVPCVVLRPSGKVVTQECYEKLIKKDMIDPETGVKLAESDIIPLKRVIHICCCLQCKC